MRRLIVRDALETVSVLLLALLVAAAAVLPAKADSRFEPCLEVSLEGLAGATGEAEVVVLGEIRDGPADGGLQIHPSVYFKGPAGSADPALVRVPEGDCPAAELQTGQRIIFFGRSTSGGLVWPSAGAVVFLTEGSALLPGSGERLSESALVALLQRETGQYAVPAGPRSPIADLQSAILPVTLALVALFAVGLVLMRVWHRIDPS